MNEGVWAQIAANLPTVGTDVLRHLEIVLISVLVGCLIAVPLGVILSRRPKVAEPVIALTGFLQTVPSLALLALVLPILGIGLKPAVAAMALYALLPILRNTYAGVRGVDWSVVNCARAMGMSPMQVLTQVELPLAAPVIIAGIRLSTIYIVSWAVLASLIGAGGLGDLIFEGLDSYNFGLVFAGAIPAALLAIGAGLLFNWAQAALTPKALRLQRERREAVA